MKTLINITSLTLSFLLSTNQLIDGVMQDSGSLAVLTIIPILSSKFLSRCCYCS